MKTTLVIAPGTDAEHDRIGCVFNLLVLGTGEHLASHFCSNYTFAPGDLYHNRPGRQKIWKERFGDIEIKFINETDIDEDELLSRNKAWFQSIPTTE